MAKQTSIGAPAYIGEALDLLIQELNDPTLNRNALATELLKQTLMEKLGRERFNEIVLGNTHIKTRTANRAASFALASEKERLLSELDRIPSVALHRGEIYTRIGDFYQ